MWNYNFIPPYFIILVTFLIYYFFQPRLPVKLNKSFLGIIIVDLLVVFSDLAASLSLDYLADSSVFYLKTINIVYFLFFQLRELAVFEFGSLVEVVFTLGTVYLAAYLLYLLTELLNGGDVVLFVLPFSFHRSEFFTKL